MAVGGGGSAVDGEDVAVDGDGTSRASGASTRWVAGRPRSGWTSHIRPNPTTNPAIAKSEPIRRTGDPSAAEYAILGEVQYVVKIYTKTGDSGETGLFGGTRVGKDAARVEAYGTVDELNAALGMVMAALPAPPGTPPPMAADPATPLPARDFAGLRALLATIQEGLFDLGADLASAPGKKGQEARTTDVAIAGLERAIDALEEDLPPLRNFILPGGSPAAAALHVARAVCRRAERRVVALARADPVDPVVVRYLNRMSDLLFVAARWVNARLGVADPIWQTRAR